MLSLPDPIESGRHIDFSAMFQETPRHLHTLTNTSFMQGRETSVISGIHIHIMGSTTPQHYVLLEELNELIFACQLPYIHEDIQRYYWW
jgi:hypothetical protein